MFVFTVASVDGLKPFLATSLFFFFFFSGQLASFSALTLLVGSSVVPEILGRNTEMRFLVITP